MLSSRTWGFAAVGAVVIAEEVCFSGQPTDGSTGRQIASYYGSHQLQILAGNVLWIAAATLLVGATRRLVTTAVERAIVYVAGGLMLATSAVALLLTASASTASYEQARLLWQLEGALFIASYWAWTSVLVLLAVRAARAGRALALPLSLLALFGIFDVAAAGWWFVLLGVALASALAPSGVRPTPPRSERTGAAPVASGLRETQPH